MEKTQSAFLRPLQKLGAGSNSFLAEIGSITWFLMMTARETRDSIFRGRLPLSKDLFFEQTDRSGPQAVLLVSAVSCFLGLTTAVLAGDQLARLGSASMVPGLVTVSFTREMGALLTGIVMAARSGAGFTAELGTMVVSDEVDALETMGIGPLRYLVLPRILALSILMPCLTVISIVAALLGAAFISKIQFQISYGTFYDLALSSVHLKDLASGMIKAFLFGGLISTIACYRGMRVQGGAQGVGNYTISSVVTSISTVIGCDMICNLILVRVS